MKTYVDLQTIFSCFNGNSEKSVGYLFGENWEIAIFKPFERKGKVIYSFRLYGEVDGSIFASYNSRKQWCGGVDYSLDINNGKVIRKVYLNKLNSVIDIKINVLVLLDSI